MVLSFLWVLFFSIPHFYYSEHILIVIFKYFREKDCYLEIYTHITIVHYCTYIYIHLYSMYITYVAYIIQEK